MIKAFFICVLSFILFSVNAQKARRVFGNPNAIIFDVALHPVRKIIASASADTISVWNYVSGKAIWQRGGQKILSIKIRDNRIAGVSADGSIAVWNIDTGDQFLSKHISDNPLTTVTWLDSLVLVSGNDAGQMFKFNTLSGQVDLMGKQDCGITALAITHKGQKIISGNTQGFVSLWNPDDLKPVRSVRAGRKWIRTIAVSDNDQTVLTSGDDGGLRTWNLSDDLKLITSERSFSWVLSADYYSSDPKNIIITTGDYNGKIRIRLHFGEYNTNLKSMINGVVLLRSEFPAIAAAVATHGEGLLVLESSAFKLKELRRIR